MSSKSAAVAAQAVNRVIPVHKKYTVQSTGIWERIRRALAVDPTRSNGVPLNPQFRNPPPGSNETFSFVDPVTIPAGDIAENPYFKRDARRSYPQLSVVSQSDMVGLLTVGSEKAPKRELIGEEGQKALVQTKQEGEMGLAAFFKKEGGGKAVLDERGLPPLPSGLHLSEGAKRYERTEENAYPEEYPCRTFA